MWFLHGCLDVSYRSWHKSKNPCPCGNHTFLNLVHHQNLESTQPVALCFQSLIMHLIGKSAIPIWAWVLAIIGAIPNSCREEGELLSIVCQMIFLWLEKSYIFYEFMRYNSLHILHLLHISGHSNERFSVWQGVFLHEFASMMAAFKWRLLVFLCFFVNVQCWFRYEKAHSCSGVGPSLCEKQNTLSQAILLTPLWQDMLLQLP